MRAAVAALLDVLGVVLHVAAVEHGVLRRGDVDERCLHAGQHVLHPAEVDVAVDLADVVGRAADVVLDQVAALQHGDLGQVGADLDAHEVAADRAAVALAAAALLERSRSRRSASRRRLGGACARALAASAALGRRRAALAAGACAALGGRRRGRGAAPAPAAPGGCRRSVACARAPARRPRPRPALARSARAAPGVVARRRRRRSASRAVGLATARPPRVPAARFRAAVSPAPPVGRSGSSDRGVPPRCPSRPSVVPLSCARRGRRRGDRQRQHLAPVSVVLDPLMCPCRSDGVQRPGRCPGRPPRPARWAADHARRSPASATRGAVDDGRQRHDLRAHVVDAALALALAVERQRAAASSRSTACSRLEAVGERDLPRQRRDDLLQRPGSVHHLGDQP